MRGRNELTRLKKVMRQALDVLCELIAEKPDGYANDLVEVLTRHVNDCLMPKVDNMPIPAPGTETARILNNSMKAVRRGICREMKEAQKGRTPDDFMNLYNWFSEAPNMMCNLAERLEKAKEGV